MILTNLRPCQVLIPGTAGVRVSWTYVYIFLKTESKWQYFKKNCLENLHIVELSSEIVTVFSSSLFQPVLFPWLPTAEGYDSNLRCLDNRPMWQIKGKTCYHGLFPHVRWEKSHWKSVQSYSVWSPLSSSEMFLSWCECSRTTSTGH